MVLNIITVILILFLLIQKIILISPDPCLTIEQVLEKRKYTFEKYKITTDDGYIVSLYRIVGKINTNYNETDKIQRIPLILQHGISTSADVFLRHADYSPALYFFEQGFDVWLPNIRGTSYSNSHLKFDNESPEYWNYTFEELGKYDTHAFIDFVYNKTQQKVLYLGVSQGFTQLMAGFSLEPEFFIQRVRKVMGWAPVVRIDLTTHPFILLGALSRVGKLGEILGLKYLFKHTYESCMEEALQCKEMTIFCKLKYLFAGDFYTYYSNIYGFSQGRESTSFKDILHLANNVANQGFYRFYKKNGELEPYDLSKIKTVKFGLCIGEGDMLAPIANGEYLKKIFTENGNLEWYEIYNYLGHESFIASHEHHKHFDDTVKFFKN